MIEQSTIQKVCDVTAAATIKELIKQGMMQTKNTAIDLVKDDIEQFNHVIELMNQGQLPSQLKQDEVYIVKSMKKTLNRLKNLLTDKEFAIFYSFYFENQSITNLIFQFELDKRTIQRAIKKALSYMAAYMHPDAFINEIVN